MTLGSETQNFTEQGGRGRVDQGEVCLEAGLELGLLRPTEQVPAGTPQKILVHRSLYGSSMIIFEGLVICSQVFEKLLESQ